MVLRRFDRNQEIEVFSNILAQSFKILEKVKTPKQLRRLRKLPKLRSIFSNKARSFF